MGNIQKHWRGSFEEFENTSLCIPPIWAYRQALRGLLCLFRVSELFRYNFGVFINIADVPIHDPNNHYQDFYNNLLRTLLRQGIFMPEIC